MTITKQQLYIKHSRAYLRILRSLLPEFGSARVSYYDWLFKMAKLPGSFSVRYEAPMIMNGQAFAGTPDARFTYYDVNHKRVLSTNKLCEFIRCIIKHLS